MQHRFMTLVLFALFAVQVFGPAQAQTFTTRGHQIQSNGQNWCAGGVNAFDQFGPSNASGRGIKVVREVVENFSSCLMGSGTQYWNGSYLHGLQDIVNTNRANGEITILCVFSWDTSGAITGGDPSNSSSYPWFSSGQYASQLAALAKQFKGQSDVWIDPWNEPNFSSQSDWNSCVTTMYNAVRNTGNTNILLIPTNNWDADENDYLNGTGWLSGKSNVTGTIHIYSGWDWDSAANIQHRLQTILNTGWPLIVGEIGPDSYQSDPIRGIQATIAAHVPTLAWNWDSSDGDQLQNGGTLTSWGSEWFGDINQYAPPAILANGTYTLTPQCAPGARLDVYNAGTASSTNVDIYASNGSSAQRWTFTNEGGNVYKLQPVCAPGLCLDVSNGGNANYTNVQVWTDNGTPSQRWTVTAVNGGYTLTPQCATSTCLDVSNGGNANYTNVDIYASNGTGAQVWSITPG